MSPRTQQERRETTTAALVEAARALFAADGYAATSLEAVAAKAGVTKGAVYHHFAGKRELFAAVFAAEQQQVLEVVTVAYGSKPDPWEAFEASCRAFLEHCLKPDVQRIFLLDAPTALGWEKTRQLEGESLELMRVAIQRAIAEGRIPPREPGPLTNLLFGALCEGAMTVARSPDQAAAHRQTLDELHRLFESLGR